MPHLNSLVSQLLVDPPFEKVMIPMVSFYFLTF